MGGGGGGVTFEALFCLNLDSMDIFWHFFIKAISLKYEQIFFSGLLPLGYQTRPMDLFSRFGHIHLTVGLDPLKDDGPQEHVEADQHDHTHLPADGAGWDSMLYCGVKYDIIKIVWSKPSQNHVYF